MYAKAELEDGYKPTKKTRYNVSIAKAEADYSVAMEKCDDKAGNDKDVCVKEAKAAQTAAKADAKSLLKTSEANQVANDKTASARGKGCGNATTSATPITRSPGKSVTRLRVTPKTRASRKPRCASVSRNELSAWRNVLSL